jgi:hypothetical protein
VRSIEAGYSYQTDFRRALSVIVILGILELLNLMTFFPTVFDGQIIYFPAAILIVINLIIFLMNKRYRNIVDDLSVIKANPIYKFSSIAYIITTVAAFALTRSLV